MKWFGSKFRKRTSAGKVMTAALVGSAVGAAVALLMAPTSGREMIRRIKGEAMGPRGARERAKSAAGNVERQARELAADVSEPAGAVREAVSHRRRAMPESIPELEN